MLQRRKKMGYKLTQESPPLLCIASLNTSCPKTVFPSEARFLLYVFFTVVFLLTFLGNFLVIVTVLHFKQLHTPTNYLILSLAVADLLVGGVVMPPSMIRSVETCWYLGRMFCKIHSSLDVTLCTASILNLCIISVDRYYAVCHPLLYRSRMTSSTTLLMILVCWSVAIFVGFGITFLELGILGVEDFYYANVFCEGGCFVFLSNRASIVFPVFCFYIPSLVMISVYTKVLHVAQIQAQFIRNQGQIKTSSQQKTVRKTELKATKTLAVVIAVYLLLWAPFFLGTFLSPYLGNAISPFAFDIIGWLGYSNSTCNPIVYALFYSWFRKSFRLILFGKIFQRNSSKIRLL